jgi:hypothetical protein
MIFVRVLTATLAVATAVLATAAGAQAQQPEKTWTCRASAAYLAGPPGRLEPLLANGLSSGAVLDRPTCADDSASVAQIDQDGLELQAPAAATNIDPDGIDAPRAQLPSASATLANVEIRSPDGSFSLTADAASSAVSGSCTAGDQPALTGTSTVTDVKINDQAVPASDVLTQVGDGLNGSPLGGLIQVKFNEEERTGDAGSADEQLVRRAIHVKITDAAGATVFEAVVAESKVGRHGAVCAPALRAAAARRARASRTGSAWSRWSFSCRAAAVRSSASRSSARTRAAASSSRPVTCAGRCGGGRAPVAASASSSSSSAPAGRTASRAPTSPTA